MRTAAVRAGQGAWFATFAVLIGWAVLTLERAAALLVAGFTAGTIVAVVVYTRWRER